MPVSSATASASVGSRSSSATENIRRTGPRSTAIGLVLTLGSEWNVYRPETAELVEAEATLVRAVVAQDLPLLAICFGAQVLSHALGGTVSRLPAPEIGWIELAVDGAGVAGRAVAGVARRRVHRAAGLRRAGPHGGRAPARSAAAAPWARSSTPR